ncbi:MAG: Adaptive-response sensory-kinase SasA [Phycisphaerae bacterium]|nr:Adaptive-response sensory-kinase SasA [Phycisphaerae bacterium]
MSSRPNTSEPVKRQNAFYDQLLDYRPIDPSKDYEFIAGAWREVFTADWAWLWLFNPNTSAFELVACVSAKGAVEDDRAKLPRRRWAPGDESIATYCCLTSQAEYVKDDFEVWNKSIDGRAYRVTTAHNLKEMGCRSFEVIPLTVPEDDGSRRRFPAVGVVSVHWEIDNGRLFPLVERAVKNMGRLTALVIRDSIMSEQREILVELNRLALDYLTRRSRKPENDRREYLAGVFRLIRKRLSINKISIFYHRPFTNEVCCIATTGLRDPRKNRTLAENELDQAVYTPMEGLTGCCFATGETLIVREPRKDKRCEGKFLETRDIIPEPGGEDPCTLVAIRRSANREFRPAGDTRAEQFSLGIIRCKEHTPKLYPDTLCHFNPTEVETLEFIANQLAHVLESFAQQIRRERAVSIVKHDLATPLVMIRDSIADVIRGEQQGLPPGKHDLQNIEISAHLAANLVRQLDAEPDQIGPIDAAPTLLEGDIVARLRSMLSRYARTSRTVELSFDGFRDIPRLFVDRGLIERAVFNLLLNAIKYSNRGTTIRILGGRTTGGFFVDVINTGLGITTDEERLLFQAGFRSPRVAAEYPGLGLGLAITRAIMSAHGGKVTLEQRTEPTRFRLFFPQTLQFSEPKGG